MAQFHCLTFSFFESRPHEFEVKKRVDLTNLKSKRTAQGTVRSNYGFSTGIDSGCSSALHSEVVCWTRAAPLSYETSSDSTPRRRLLVRLDRLDAHLGMVDDRHHVPELFDLFLRQSRRRVVDACRSQQDHRESRCAISLPTWTESQVR